MAQICPKDCPRRGKPGCHTEKCPDWKAHVERKKEEYRLRKEAVEMRRWPYEAQ